VSRGRPDVVIIGAGVIGCAVAREVARRGRTVLVVERDSPGRRATWAAAGMLSPLGEAGEAGPFLELADESLSRYAGFADALRSETSIDIEYQPAGKLHVLLDDDDGRGQLTQLEQLAAGELAQRFDVRLLDAAEARRLEPALSERVTAALLIGRDHRVNNRLLAQALLAGAGAAGVGFRTASPVVAVTARHGAVTGVRLASGERIEADHVILAAGAWSRDVEGLPRPVPVRPVKGQMFAVDARARAADRPVAPPLQRVIYSADCYIIPRDDGRLLVGATIEDVGFRKGATPRGITGLAVAATAVVPLIADLPLVETWAGFRPGTPDGLPIIGTDADLAGLIYATGHYRNGILLAPVTAACVADLVTGRTPPVALGPFGIERFGDGGRDDGAG
jgi:glycine oxidase